MRAALRTPGFAPLFAGLAASMLGDSLLLLVLAIWAKSLTGSSSQAGLVILTLSVPGLVAPALGWVVDGFRRRPFLIVANLASAAMLLPLYLVHGRGQVWLLYAVGVLYGVSFMMLAAGLAGLLKVILTPWTLSIAASAALLSIVDYRVQLATIAIALVSIGGLNWRGARRVSQPAAMMAE